jgi:MFS transporter, DHA2 family, multidrug resistance protein
MNGIGSRRWWALGALAVSLLVVGLDGTVLSVALPTLATRLDASTGQLQWFVDAYLLVLAAALLPAGLLGDRFGRKKLLLGALAVFGASSVACAYAGSAGALIGARAALGLSAAFLIPLSMAVLPVLFEPAERARALGVWVTASAASFPIGPIVGGWLLDRFWWGSVFLINVPVIVLGLVAVAALVPESRNPRAPRLDVPGALTSSLGLAGVTYGFIEAGEKGWGDPVALAALAAGAVVLAGFALWQRGVSRRPDGQPLVDLGLFRSRSFTWGMILATVISFSLFGLLFAMPQYFQAIEGADALGTGLRLLPVIGGLLVGSRLGDLVARRAGAKVTVATGLALMAGGLFAGATTGAASGYGLAAGWMGVVGAGVGFGLPAAMDAALGALSVERSGVGSGLIQAGRQVGSAIGVAVLGTVVNSSYRGGLDLAGLPAQAAATVRESVSAGVAVARQLGSTPLLDLVRGAFVQGMDAMLLVCGVVTAVGVVLAVLMLPARAEPVVGPVGARAESRHEIDA